MKGVSAGPERQRGYFTLISAGVAVTVFGILMAIQAAQYVSRSRNDAAESTGVLAGQFKNALRAAVAREGTALATGTYTGTGWLKRAGACSGANGSQAYLPCEFPNHLPLGLAYRTTVSVSGGTVRARVALGAPESGGETYPYLAGSIVTAINGASNDHVTPVTQTYHVAEHDTAGNITITVSNGPENNEYLKRDGSVRATGDFEWGGFDLNNVGELAASQVRAGEVTTNRLTSNGNITASGTVRGQNIYGSRFVDTDVYSGTQYTMNPSSNSNLRGSLSVGGNITTDATLAGARFRLTDTESEGSSCSRRYLAFNGSGEPMYCNSSSRWQSLVGGNVRYTARNITMINTTYRYPTNSTRVWNFTSSELGIPEDAYAVQVQAVCGAVNQDNVVFRITTSASGSTQTLLQTYARGGGDNIRVMNTILVPVANGNSTITITKPSGGQSCEETGFQVRMLGYFRS